MSSVSQFRQQLDDRVGQLKELTEFTQGRQVDLTLSARSDGNTKKIYWRFKSSKKSRKYSRLTDELIASHVMTLDRRVQIQFKTIEAELIYINGNYKVMKGILDALDQVILEEEAISEFPLTNS